MGTTAAALASFKSQLPLPVQVFFVAECLDERMPEVVMSGHVGEEVHRRVAKQHYSYRTSGKWRKWRLFTANVRNKASPPLLPNAHIRPTKHSPY